MPCRELSVFLVLWKGELHLHVSQFSWNKCSWGVKAPIFYRLSAFALQDEREKTVREKPNFQTEFYMQNVTDKTQSLPRCIWRQKYCLIFLPGLSFTPRMLGTTRFWRTVFCPQHDDQAMNTSLRKAPSSIMWPAILCLSHYSQTPVILLKSTCLQ